MRREFRPKLNCAVSPFLLAICVCLMFASATFAQTSKVSDSRLAKSLREERGGWVFAHLEGAPRQIGYQYGYLLAPEIDRANLALRHFLKHNTNQEWTFYRNTAERLFWSKVDAEYKEELAGMAEGLQARGYKYDAVDMLAHNSWIDIALYYLPYMEAKQKKTAQSKAPPYCSAFIATGSATSDGKIVMGHNAWIDYIIGEHWNVVLDIKPERGNRILMDAWPGFIHSGDDFAINSAGILITETTIYGFLNFDENGIPEFVRARKAEQYANSIDDFVRIMKTGNNGGYANTWLVGDTKTNEIGKLELGLKNVTFERISDGVFVGANFPENPKMIAEECALDVNKSSNACSNRRARWAKLIAANKGKINAEVAKAMLADDYDETLGKEGASGRTINGRGDLDARPMFPDVPAFDPLGAINAKVVTSAMAQKMSFWARAGFPDGSEFNAQTFLAQHNEFSWQAAYLRDIKANAWTLFQAHEK
jgi:hypothetical protein